MGEHVLQVQHFIIHKLPITCNDLQGSRRKGDFFQLHQIRRGICNDLSVCHFSGPTFQKDAQIIAYFSIPHVYTFPFSLYQR